MVDRDKLFVILLLMVGCDEEADFDDWHTLSLQEQDSVIYGWWMSK